MTAAPRRTCPACARRYAGLIAPECVVCDGTGVLGLGAAALANAAPGAVARAVELYLEVKARLACTLPYADRRDALELAVLELRTAGVLSGIADTGQHAAQRHADADARTVLELDAYRLATTTGTRPERVDLERLTAPPLPSLDDARPAGAIHATASANGHRARLSLVTDPIDPLGPNLTDLEAERLSLEHAGRVTAGAVDHLARHPRRPKAAAR